MPTGFFGKLPASGDFVARGLGPRVRPALDRWLTLHLAGAAQTPESWPKTGLRAIIDGPTGALALTILASQDALGRPFPLAACCHVVQTDRAGIEIWADVLHPALNEAVSGQLTADALFDQIKAVSDPTLSEAALDAPLLWGDQSPVVPTEAIRQIFGAI